MQTGRIDEIIKETKEKYGINIRIFLDKKKKTEEWVVESLDKLTMENPKIVEGAIEYATKIFAESQYQELLDRAKSELKASEVLYGNELYPEAVYFFQQSVEKTAKAFVIISRCKPFSESEFRKIGHEALKIYIDYIIPATKEIIEPYNEFVKGTSSEKTDLGLDQVDDFLLWLKLLEKEDDQKIINMNIENILLYVIKKCKDLDQKNKIELETLKRHLVKVVLYHNRRAEIDPKRLDELIKIDSFEKFIRESYSNEGQIHIYQLFLLIITLPHEAYTRYPKADLTITPKIYTKNLSIVEKLPELIDVQSKVLYKLEELILSCKEFIGNIEKVT